jgi:hypothetical protein
MLQIQDNIEKYNKNQNQENIKYKIYGIKFKV